VTRDFVASHPLRGAALAFCLRPGLCVEPGTQCLFDGARCRGVAVTRFLQSYDSTLIEGPKQNALFRVHVAERRLAKDDLARIVRQMQEDKIVRFAAPTV